MKRKFTEQEIIRREKLQKLKDLGRDPFEQSFKISTSIKKLKDKYSNSTKEELQENKTENYSLAGRIMMIRNQGKAMFVAIKDNNQTIQFYLREDELTKEDWEVATLLDIGDIISSTGRIMKTNTGEITLRSSSLNILVKSLRPLPEKFHGLQNIEEKYRRRYLDIMMNDESYLTFIKRFEIIKEIRLFLSSKGYLEVETPILHPTLGGASAEPFVTHHKTLDMDLYLRVAPELYLKRLIVGGMNKVFEIGRLFRNEGISIKHNPEFTSMELYEAYGDMDSMMEITEDIIEHVALKIKDTTEISYQGKNLSLKKPFKRIEMVDSIKEVTGIDFNSIKTIDEAKALATKEGFELEKHEDSIGHIINKFFEERVEKTLTQPTFITGYPIEVSPLAKRRKNTNLTDRFELFIDGREYANAFSELNDSDDQFKRFEEQLKEKEKGNKEANEMDIDYIESLDFGMPPTGGMGIGVDRLVMLLTDSASIRDVLLFPHQRRKNNE